MPVVTNKDQEHRQEPGEALDLDEIHDADGRDPHRDEVPERHLGAADLVGEQAADRADQRPTSGPRKAMATVIAGNCVLSSSGNAAE